MVARTIQHATVARSPVEKNPLTLAKKEIDIDTALSRAEAAVWLLDQIAMGELGFLTPPDTELPSWISTGLGLKLKPSDVREWLSQFALEAIVTSLKEIRKEVA